LCHQKRTERRLFSRLHSSTELACIVVPISRGAQALNSGIEMWRRSSLITLADSLPWLFSRNDNCWPLSSNRTVVSVRHGRCNLVGTCDTCGRLSELFQLPGRKDINCTECNADISTLISLYRRWAIADRDSEHSSDLEAQLISVLHRSLGRWLGACSNASTQFCEWPETGQKENESYLN
jgi:hypothetical protein